MVPKIDMGLKTGGVFLRVLLMFCLEDLPDDVIRQIYDLINQHELKNCVDSLNDTESDIWPECCISRDYPHIRFSLHTCILAATNVKCRRMVAE